MQHKFSVLGIIYHFCSVYRVTSDMKCHVATIKCVSYYDKLKIPHISSTSIQFFAVYL